MERLFQKGGVWKALYNDRQEPLTQEAADIKAGAVDIYFRLAERISAFSLQES